MRRTSSVTQKNVCPIARFCYPLDFRSVWDFISLTPTPSPVSSAAMANRPTIAETFAALKQKKQIAMMPFIPAGYPDLETTAAVLPALSQAGANFIEVGIPFSDPIAD